ncbi:acetaldehyde dehydrogenase (acetylating) [Micromonospora craniellae]|uniref:Acetaldehyde dehydrogenase n=1 Tax=Micromonospora craniellae TaxID=2294034 RepID=A0A372FZJ3_9ACTN|nr:acetaldehyde dehydrogenase (acetylating) [Micromonospora craniellae]RFS45910.1 acetaldehyde dehydrogenase (acetylating) [Micromonospora craniellae]
MGRPGDAGRSRKVAVIGSGNIGTDLMMKVLRSDVLSMGAMVGIDPRSDGLARADKLGVPTTAEGVRGLLGIPELAEIAVVFDATSARAHVANYEQLRETGIPVVDLTPAAIGPLVVPAVNLAELAHEPNVNMVTCGGQATIPIVAAVSAVSRVHYAEIVASIASRSAGPGTRANIDEFTKTTSRAIETVGNARRGKAIIILNPAEPPMIMRDTVYCVTGGGYAEEIRRSVAEMAQRVREYVPGYSIKQEIQVRRLACGDPLRSLAGDQADGDLDLVTVFLEVAGAGDYLPAYAGNLDIMTSAAVRVGELLASRQPLTTWKASS